MNEDKRTNDAALWRRVAIASLAMGALGLYLATLSRGAFPGLPAQSVCWHLGFGYDPFFPRQLLDVLWGRLVRTLDMLPGGAVPWAGAASAIFGSVCVALVGALTMRLRYPLHDKYDLDETRREGQARILAGATAGMFAALSIPFWILSTRSLPGTFHLSMLLGAAFLFSEYQRTGKAGYLYALGALYGVGITEYPTFLVFAPFAVLLVARAMLQRAAFSWGTVWRMAGCAVPGLALYLLNGWTLLSEPAVRLRGFGTIWAVIWYIWRDQWHLIVHAPQTTGFLMVLALTAVPWGMLFLLRPKKPAWRYSAWQVFLRLVVLAAALGALFNAPLSPWRYFNMHYLMATPYLILAACAGYVAGDFWVMGQTREHRNAGIGQPLRTAMGVLGMLVPVAALAAGWLNLPTADGRPGNAVERMAEEALDAMGGCEVLISNGSLDDSVRLVARRKGVDVAVMTTRAADSKLYREQLATRFATPRQQALLQVGFNAFIQDYLNDDGQLRRTAALDMADPMREYGYLVPDRLVYRVELDETKVDLDALAETQRAFWAQIEQMAKEAPDERNPAHFYVQYSLRTASKVANNLGFAQAERGNPGAAKPLFQQARRICPDNVSALLNLLTIAQAEGGGAEEEEYRKEWEEFKQRHVDSRVMWSLGALHGYVYNTGFLVRHGMMWAVSGKPRMAEAEMRRASGKGIVDPAVRAFLARAFLQSGDYDQSAEYYRQVLEDNPRDAKTLAMLVQLAIRTEDYAEAERLMARAEEAGANPAQFQFERGAMAFLQGKPDAALAALKALVAQNREDARAWALLALLTADGKDQETYEKAVKALQTLRGNSPDVRLMLAELHGQRKDWAQARVELEQAVQAGLVSRPQLVRAWEMLVNVDYQERKQDLAEDHVRILLSLDPGNYVGNLMLGSFQYARGQYALAESSYRTAIQARRDPAALNDLAYLLLVKGGPTDEARELIAEALALQPENPVFLSTRSDLLLREGKLAESVADLQKVLAAMPDNPQALLLTADVYAARGQSEAAKEMAESLAKREGELAPEQRARLQDLLRRLR